MEPQALSGTETAAPEGPALGFLISPEVRPLGPPQTAFGVSHPTQSPQTLSCAPQSRDRPRRLPSSRKPQVARGGSEAQETLQPSVWTPPFPGCGTQWPFSRRRPSALWALRNDRRFQSPQNHTPLPAAPLHLTPVLFLRKPARRSPSPVSSWQKGVSLVASKISPHRPWVGSNHQPFG